MANIKESFYVGNITQPILFEYNSTYQASGADGSVDTLSCYKISIVLTDGLQANLISGLSFPSRAGDVLLFNPHEPHYGHFLRSGVHKYIDFFIPDKVLSGYWEEETELFSLLENLENTRELYFYIPDEKREYLLSLADLMIKTAAGRKSTRKLLLSAIFVQFMDFITGIQDSCKIQNPFSSVPDFLLDTMNYISTNFAEITGLSQIEAHSGYSARYLTECFKKHFGTTVYEYLLSLKLHNAKTLLASGSNVTYACFDSGFVNYSYFIQLFKGKYGMTPLQFKKQSIAK